MARRSNSKSNFSTDDRGSTVIATLEKSWSALCKVEPRIPTAVLTLVDARSRLGVRGYFADTQWKKPGRRGGAHEVAISPQLIGQASHLLATILHEAAHAILFEAGKNAGVGSTRYYHTKVFRDQCIELGLECFFHNTRYGWTITQWPRGDGVPKRFLPALRILECLPSGTEKCRIVRRSGGRLPPAGRTKLICKCSDEKRVIYVPNLVAAVGGIACSICNQAFSSETLE